MKKDILLAIFYFRQSKRKEMKITPPINFLKNIFIKEKTLLDHWFETDERIRFSILASLNMGLRYLLFVILSLIFTTLHYQLTLLLMWLISSFIAFYSYKKFVFNTQGNHLQEYLKSIAIWILSYFINAGILSFLINRYQINLFLSQGIAICFLLISNYLLFKHFAFRQPSPLKRWEKLFRLFDILSKN